ncbi:MAG: hydrogenase maturation protease [Candidatus Limnocylindrales bacterium]|jgi:hydrogenase maturation protease
MAAPGAAETALIVRVRLPEALEAVRVGAVPNAARGLPAHVTLLYPFLAPADLEDGLRSAVARVVGRHHAFSYRMSGPARWPAVLFASVDPEGPFHSLHADLAAAFPDFPIYGGNLEFVPHVTIAEGAAAGLAELEASPAWASLPATLTAGLVELIVLDDGRWTAKWQFPLRAAVRVLVCGERLRGDDGAAARAIETLDAETRALVDIAEVGQLSIEALLDVPEGAALVVVDAAVGLAPGAVVTLPLDDVGRGGTLPASSHALPPDQVIGLAAELRGELPRGCFVGIGGVEFGFGEGLSPRIEAGLPAFAATIAAEIRRLATG